MYRIKVKFYNKPIHLPIAAKVFPNNIVEFTVPDHTDLDKFINLVESWDKSGNKPHVEVIQYE